MPEVSAARRRRSSDLGSSRMLRIMSIIMVGSTEDVNCITANFEAIDDGSSERLVVPWETGAFYNLAANDYIIGEQVTEWGPLIGSLPKLGFNYMKTDISAVPACRLFNRSRLPPDRSRARQRGEGGLG